MAVFSASACALPPDALLTVYGEDARHFTDCYVVEVAGPVSLSEFVTAFYTTRLFRVERLILSLVLGARASDADAADLANGKASRYSAWSVEGRRETQLLMCPVDGRTRSWFMATPGDDAGAASRLYFGSAVLNAPKSGLTAFMFKALLGFHKLYSLALLSSARAKLGR